MKRIIANPKVQNHEEFTVNFRIRTFEDVSWKTAQSTGALGYMPYEQAHEYSNLYSQQNEVYLAEKQAARGPGGGTWADCVPEEGRGESRC